MSFWKGAGDYLGKASEFVEAAKVAANKAADTAVGAVNKAAEQVQATDLVEQARAVANSAADAVSRAAEQVDLLRPFVEDDLGIFDVRPDLLVIEFPSEEKIGPLSDHLNMKVARKMLVYNMSERRYDTTRFQGEVVDVAFRGLPAPPLALLMELCLSAHHWLSSEPENVLVVHCFLGYSRSAIFLSCFMAFRGLFCHPVDALHEVCERLGIDDAHAVLPSQRRYLTYFDQCQQGTSPLPLQLRLRRATLHGIPRLEPEGPVALRPYVEVWNHGVLLYSSYSPATAAPATEAGADAGGEEAVAPSSGPPDVAEDQGSVHFDLPESVVVTDDVLMRLRHVRADGSKETACRLAFHTAFVPEVWQIAKHELDGTSDDARFPEDAFLELTFVQVGDATGVEAPPVYEKSRELSRRLREEELRRQQEEQQRREEERRRKERELARTRAGLEARDEFEELEETLRRSTANRTPSTDSRRSGTAGAAAPAGDAAELRRALEEAVADDKAPPAATAKSVEDLVKQSNDDIDALFSDFDMAIQSVSAPAPSAAQLEAPAAQAAPAAATAPAPAAPPTAAPAAAVAAAPAAAPVPVAAAAPTPAADAAVASEAVAAADAEGTPAAPMPESPPAAAEVPVSAPAEAPGKTAEAPAAAPPAAVPAAAPAEAPAAAPTSGAAEAALAAPANSPPEPSQAAPPAAVPAAAAPAAAAPAAKDGPGAPAAGPAAAPTAAPATAATPAPASGGGKDATEDIFADMDAFLAELETPAAKK